MSERPILFSAPMIRALFSGTKTQTRRIIKPQPEMTSTGYWHVRWQVGGGCFVPITAPDGQLQGEILDGLRIQVGDRLWVREAHYLTDDGHYERAVYAADEEDVREHNKTMERLAGRIDEKVWRRHVKLRPSIHMPRWASRLTLTVTDVRVQRLPDISEVDARSEGVECDSDGWRDYQMPATQCCASPKTSFLTLWDSINGAGSWQANPWITAYTFTVERRNIDATPTGEASDV